MSAGEFMPSGGASRRKKPLTAAQRRKIRAAFRAIPGIQQRNDDIAAMESDIADSMLESFIHPDNAENETDHDDRTSDGQQGAARSTTS